MELRFPKYDLKGLIEWARYGNGQNAIRVIGDLEPLGVATVNLEELGAPAPGPDQIWVKTWAGNEGVDKALEEAGVATPAREVFVVNDFGSVAVLMNLTPEAIRDRNSQEHGNG